MLKNKIKILWPLLVLFALTVIFFWPLLFGGKTYLFGDLLTRHYPWKVFYSQSLAQGQLPLWASNMGLGYPLLAGGEIGALYLPNLILYYLLPVTWAYNLSFVIHFFLAAVFMYFFARTLELSPASSLLASLAFAFSGFMMAHIRYLNTLSAIIYLPLIFALINLYFKNPRTLYLVGIAAVWALQFYAGAPAISFLTALVAVLYVFLPSVWKSIETRNINPLKQDFIWGICTAFLALLLALAQILPTYELFSFSQLNHQGINSLTIHLLSLRPLELLRNYLLPFFLHPHADAPLARGTPIFFPEHISYIGLIPLALTFFSLGKPISKIKIFFWFLLAFSWLMVSGEYLPFYHWLARLPGFKYIEPTDFLLISTFSLTILAGSGFNRLKEEKIRLIKLWPFLACLLLAGVLIYLRLYYLLPTETFVDFLPPAVLLLFLLALLFHCRNLLRTPIFVSLTLILIITDLHLFGFFYNPLSTTLKAEHPLVFVSYLQKDREPWRLLSDYLPVTKGIRLSPGSYHMIFGLNDVITVNTLNLYREYQLIPDRTLSGKDSSLRHHPEAYWGFFNVKYFIINYPQLLENNGRFFTVDKRRQSQNPHFKPRAYLAHKVEVLPKEEDILKRMTSKEFLQGNILLLEEKPPQAHQVSKGRSRLRKKGEISCFKYRTQTIEMEVTMKQKGWLVLKDNYYPGWEAWVDGKQTKIYRGNYVMRAVFLEAGNHQIEFIYRPKVFKWGMVMTILGILVAIKLSWWSIRKQELGVRDQESDKN